VEATRSPELIKGLGIERQIAQRYLQRITERAGFSIRAERFQKAAAAWLMWASSAMEALILWYGGSRVIEGNMTLGVFSGFLAIRAMVEVPIGTLVGLFDAWVRFQSALQRSDDILSVPAADEGDIPASEVVGRIEARNLGFRYGSGGRWIFRNVNLTLEPGDKVALTGPSGQGKSTLGKLLVGLLDPTEGEVLLDGVPVARYARESLAPKLGVVLQEPLLLEGNLREAVSLRIPDAAPEAITRAARLACFEEVVQRLPHAYESHLAALGSNLSGGERQRLALSQALLGDPRVLLLDEATCALDPDTERRVLDNLERLQATLVTIAHRPSVIRGAERVFSVGQGCVLELTHGTQDAEDMPQDSSTSVRLSGVHPLGAVS
jgi:ABC-type bacteriocin/lantibiotic exporter with double-glycine peptidase domain